MRVLLAVDSITTLNMLLDDTIKRSWPAGTEMQVVSIVEDGGLSHETWRKEGYGIKAIRRELERRGEQISALAVSRLQEAGIPARVVVMRGNPEFLISFAARKWPADLILIRAHNRKDFRSRLLGSVAKSVVESAPCSVEIIRSQDETDGVQRVLVATDGSDGSLAASHAVAEMSWPEQTEFKVVSVVSALNYSLEELGLSRGTRSEQAHRAVDDVVEILSATQRKVSGEVITGKAARKIIERAAAWKADLIVLGTNRGRGIKGLLLGSTSAAVANQAHCSVRVIRGKSAPRKDRSHFDPSRRSEYNAYTVSRKQTIHQV
ncbi:MAG TPA: universal stress protein [Pyrinomonadaceae bacterium]|nr:universal stress protein [Pyrinomonadaceae bacterium]